MQINTIILAGLLGLTISLAAKDAFASSVYQLSNCTAADLQIAQTELANAEKGAAGGYMSKIDVATATVYFAEVSLCAGHISKNEACDKMTKNQEILVNSGRLRFDEQRRQIEIRDFCK